MSASSLATSPSLSPSSQTFKFTSPSPHGTSASPVPYVGGHDMISMNSRFLYIHISQSQICKTRFEKHLACSLENEEGHRYHYHLIRVFFYVRLSTTSLKSFLYS